MLIETTALIKNLKGEPFEDSDKNPLTVGKMIAAALANTKSPDPLKSYVLATKFYEATENLEVSAEDVVFIKNIIKATEGNTPVVLGQLIKALEV